MNRNNLKDFSKRQFIGNKRTESRHWEISLRNKKNQPVYLIVQDQFPLSTNSLIEIERGEAPEATLEQSKGILTWKINLPPLEEKKLNFKYAVKYPKEQILLID